MIMSILNEDVNAVDVTMKGERKMSNTISVDWKTIYDGQEQEAEKIIKGLYDTKNYGELHRAMWIWLSLDGTKDKWEWFERFDVPAVSNYCFACQMAEESFNCLPKWYQEEIIGFEEDCLYFCHCCPLTDKPSGECLDGLYGKWLKIFFKKREDLAREIASLEWQYK